MHTDIEFNDPFVAGTDGIHTYRIPSLLTTPRGMVLAFAEARRDSDRDDAPKDIVLKRSTDSGRSWSDMHIAIRGQGEDAINNPCPLIEGDRIYLFAINRCKEGPWRHRHLVAWSDDDGTTWSEPEDMADRFVDYDNTFVPGPGVSLRMSSGRWILPGNVKTVGAEIDPAKQQPVIADSRSCVAYSDDQGGAWRLGAPIQVPCTNESQAVELSDGTLILNARVQAPPPDRPPHCRAMVSSRDGGETWHETSTRPDLPDPCCQGGFIRCDSACTPEQPDCLLFTNLHSTGVKNPEPRRNLTVKLSPDAGRTWPVARTIHAGPAAYSCPAMLPDGRIGLLYECGDAWRYERLRFARFGLEWLMGCR